MGKTFALKPRLFQQPDRRDIVGDTSRFNPMQFEAPERERDDGIDGGCHVALTRIGSTHPIPEASRLSTTAANVGQSEAADERIILLAKDKERVGEVAALVFAIAPDATAKGCPRKVVNGPSRFPRGKKASTFLPQRRPLRTIGHLRRTQYDTLS